MSHKIKIFASEVSSLTDARYFSAIGSHWMGHYPEKTGLTEEEFAAIKPWVSGPKWVLEQSGEKGAQSLMARLGMDLLKVKVTKENSQAQFVEYPVKEWLDLDLEIEMYPRHWVVVIDGMLSEYDIIRLKRSAGIHAILLKIENTSPDQVIYLLDKIQPYGLVVCGSKEEKTGIKSYDVINDLIDDMDAHGWL